MSQSSIRTCMRAKYMFGTIICDYLESGVVPKSQQKVLYKPWFSDFVNIDFIRKLYDKLQNYFIKHKTLDCLIQICLRLFSSIPQMDIGKPMLKHIKKKKKKHVLFLWIFFFKFNNNNNTQIIFLSNLMYSLKRQYIIRGNCYCLQIIIIFS